MLMYLVSSKLFGTLIGCFATFTLLAANGFMFAAETDYGPFLIGTLLLLLICLLYLEQQNFQRLTYLILLSLLIGCALADKLTIFPYLLPVFAYWITVIMRLEKRKIRSLIFAALAILGPLTFQLLYFLRGGWNELLSWLGPNGPSHNDGKIGLPQTFSAVKTFSDVAFGGRSPYLFRAFFGSATSKSSQLSLLLCIGVIFVIPSLHILKTVKKRGNFSSIDFIYIFPVLVLFLTPVFSYHPWHLLPLTPFVILSGFRFISNVITSVSKTQKLIPFKVIISGFITCLMFITSFFVIMNRLEFQGEVTRSQGVGIASSDIRTMVPVLIAKNVKDVTCLDYSVCLDAISYASFGQMSIGEDHTFDPNFLESGLQSLRKISTCHSAILTRDYVRSSGFFTTKLIQGNSNIFRDKDFAAKLKLTKIAEVDIQGDKLQAWQPKKCFP